MSEKFLSNAFAAAAVTFGLGVALTVGGWADVVQNPQSLLTGDLPITSHNMLQVSKAANAIADMRLR